VVALLQRRELEMDLAERKRHPLLLLIGVAVVLILAMSAASLVIAPVAKGKTYSDVRAIPHRKVGLVLGCAKQIPGGGTNPFFEKRVAAAAELYRSGKIDYLLVGGDNHVRTCDEATDMKEALTQVGVPPEKIYCDFAGFRTLDSVVRAKEVFGETRRNFITGAPFSSRSTVA